MLSDGGWREKNGRLRPGLLRLYLVTDRRWCGETALEEQVEQALRGGVTMVQLREKDADRETFISRARAVQAVCRRYGAPLIINDDVEVALAVDAAGVHIGQNDQNARAARARLGSDKILGVSARTVPQAEQAVRDGADYLGVGAVFGTATKTDARTISPARLAEVARAVEIPVVAIGGVQESNIQKLAGCGAAGVAVVSAILAAEQPCEAARRLHRLAGRIAQHTKEALG